MSKLLKIRVLQDDNFKCILLHWPKLSGRLSRVDMLKNNNKATPEPVRHLYIHLRKRFQYSVDG